MVGRIPTKKGQNRLYNNIICIGSLISTSVYIVSSVNVPYVVSNNITTIADVDRSEALAAYCQITAQPIELAI